jgi:hypothetical protein
MGSMRSVFATELHVLLQTGSEVRKQLTYFLYLYRTMKVNERILVS